MIGSHKIILNCMPPHGISPVPWVKNMSKEQEAWIKVLEAAWAEPEGFLYKVRQGNYDPKEGQKFLASLSKIRLSEDEPVERRIVSLLWYIPLFLEWQKQRVAKTRDHLPDYEQLCAQATNIIEGTLGVP